MVPTEILDRLFAAPLEDFTATRNELVKELKDEDPGAATELKALKKPTLSAWAVNQLAREEPEALNRLFELRDEIADATDAKSMRAASNDRKRSLATLAAKAGKILEASDHATSSSTIERVTQTLQAGDSDEDREAILTGRLTRDLEPSGFGGFAAFGFEAGVGDEEPERTEQEVRDEDRKAVAALKAQAVEAESEARDAELAAEEAGEEARRAEMAARATRKKATKLSEQAAEAEAAL
jgi:hypothetical protein